MLEWFWTGRRGTTHHPPTQHEAPDMMLVSDYLLLSMAAAAGPSQHGAPASLDCALNGVKAADGSCTCDPAWEGAQCERFAFVSTSDDADLN